MDAAWSEANRRYLVAVISAQREALAAQGERCGDQSAAMQELAAADAALPAPSALARLVAALGLSSFERDLVVLAAGIELDPRVRELIDRRLDGLSALEG